MDASKIKAIIAAVIATFAALYLGITAATAQFETLAWVGGGLVLVTCLLLGHRIWLLIPFLAAVNLTFWIPGQPSTLLIGQLLFLGFSTLLLLMRRLPFRLQFGELEWWILIVSAFVVQVYMRNPVGVGIFGTDTVGGKAYVLFAITAVSSILLSSLRVEPADLRWILRLGIIGGILNFGLNVIGHFVPAVGAYYGALRGFGDTDSTASTDAGQATRIGFLGNTAKNISLWVSSFISPLKSLIRPLWLLLILISLAFAAMSGFRSIIVAVGLTYILGLFYRGGFMHVVVSSLIGILAVAALAVLNLATPLPPNVQRSLSFLPGTWEQRYVTDAENSTDWRVEIWEEVLLTDRWIQNKWLGDGLGFTAKELQTQLALAESTQKGISGFDAHRETILASGDYHSGPVQTIRTIGYAGLAFLLAAMIRLAIHAHRLMRRYRNTEWYPLVLFIGIPLVMEPFFFTFVFGTFVTGSASLLLGAAMIRLLQNNLPLEALPVTNLSNRQGPQGRFTHSARPTPANN